MVESVQAPKRKRTKSTSRRRPVVVITMEPDLRAAVDELAKRRGVARSRTVDALLRDALARAA